MSGFRDGSVLIVDRQPLFRRGLRDALATAGLATTREVADAEEAVALVRALAPEACLIDASFGRATLEALADASPDTVVIVLTDVPRERECRDAVRAGAVGYLPKSTPPEQLGAAVRGALAGEAAIPRTLVAHLLRGLRDRARARRAAEFVGGVALTPREAEVLALLRRGLSTATMAAELGVSVVTVRRHVSELVRKLGVEDRAAAIALIDRA